MAEEYIKREDAIQSIIAHDLVGGDARDWAEYLLENTSTADVAPAKHGRWVKHGTRDRMTCSCCGDYWEMGLEWTSDNFNGWFKFCPNCGARMDEEVNDGQDDRDR